MSRRLYFLLPDIDTAHQVVAKLKQNNVSEDNMSVVAHDSVQTSDLPQADVSETSDLVGSAERGAPERAHRRVHRPFHEQHEESMGELLPFGAVLGGVHVFLHHGERGEREEDSAHRQRELRLLVFAARWTARRGRRGLGRGRSHFD